MEYKANAFQNKCFKEFDHHLYDNPELTNFMIHIQDFQTAFNPNDLVSSNIEEILLFLRKITWYVKSCENISFLFPDAYLQIGNYAQQSDNIDLKQMALKATLSLVKRQDQDLCKYVTPLLIESVLKTIHSLIDPASVYTSLKIIYNLINRKPNIQKLIQEANMQNAFFECILITLQALEQQTSLRGCIFQSKIIYISFQILSNIFHYFPLSDEQLDIINENIQRFLITPNLGAAVSALNGIQEIFRFEKTELNENGFNSLYKIPVCSDQSDDEFHGKIRLVHNLLNTEVSTNILHCLEWENTNESVIVAQSVYRTIETYCYHSPNIAVFFLSNSIMYQDHFNLDMDIDLLIYYFGALGVLFKSGKSLNNSVEMKTKVLPNLKEHIIPNFQIMINMAFQSPQSLKEVVIYALSELINLNILEILHIIMIGNEPIVPFFIDILNEISVTVASSILHSLIILFDFGSSLIQLDHVVNPFLSLALENNLFDAIDEAYETFGDNNQFLSQLDLFKSYVERVIGFHQIDQGNVNDDDSNQLTVNPLDFTFWN